MGTIRSLQILRAASSLMVVYAHAVFLAQVWSPVPHALLATTEEIGRLAVYVFFVISGVIISYVSYNDFARDGAVGRYVLKRLIRVVPIYWLATLLEFGWRTLRHAMPPLDGLLYSLFFIPHVIDPAMSSPLRPILGVGWTLNYEALFYVIFAACLPFNRLLGLGLAIAAIVALVLAGLLIKPFTDAREPFTALEFVTDPIVLMFAGGMLLGISARLWPGLVGKMGLTLGYGSVAAVVVGATFLAFVGSTPAPWTWRMLYWAAAIFIVACAVFEKRERFGKVFQAFEKIGDASYALYLFHFFALVGVQQIWRYFLGDVWPYAFIVVACAVGIVFGYLCHLVIEKPLLAFLTARLLPAKSSGKSARPLTAPMAT